MHSADNSYQRFIEAVERSGLHYRELESGKRAQVQTPGHSDQDRGTSITYNGNQLLVYCHNGDTDEVLDALGMTTRDLFDNPNGVRYDYGDGRLVHRSPDKLFKQSGNTKGTNLYGLASLATPGPVYVVEGEKDANTASHVWNAAAVSQAQGASTSPVKADWTPLKGREVIIVADKDSQGEKRATKVLDHLLTLDSRPESVRIVMAAEGKDLSDHIAAGHTSDDLVAVGEKVGQRRVKLVPASAVKTERVNWVIDNWIPENMLTLLAGREGIGKSTIACSWVAELTRSGTKCAYLNTEDSRALTVGPRLEAAGADLDRVVFLDTLSETGKEVPLKLPQDTKILFDALEGGNVKFLVLDAAKSAMDSRLDGYRDDDVRQFLEPIAAEADRRKITVLGLAHFGKKEGTDTGKLLLGSIAWSQIARSVLSAAVNDEGGIIVSNTKANLAREIVSREATIVSRPVQLDDGTSTELGAIEWGEFTDANATDFLAPKDNREDRDDRSGAEAWLEDYLTDRGPTPRAEVLKAAAKAGVASESTIKRAFKSLGGISAAAGFPRVATWALPVRVSESTGTPHALESGPTDPTGNKQGKRNDPTGEKSQLGHDKKNGPTGGTTGEIPNLDNYRSTINSELAETVLRLLNPEIGLGIQTIKGSLTRAQLKEFGEGTQLLDHLTHEGLITQDTRGRYRLAKEPA